MSRVVVLRDTPAVPLGEHVEALRDLGYDVHVLAPGDYLPDGPLMIDGVTVTTTPLHRWLAPGSHVARSPRWTRPLGYRLMLKATGRKAVAQMHVNEAEFRRDVAIARSGGRVPLFARARLLAARAERRWVTERAADTREAYDIRRKRQRPADKFARKWWRLTSRRHAWGRLDPGLLDSEVHLGPVLDQIEADAIHAEGAVMMSVAVRSAARRDRPVAVFWDKADEFKPKRHWVAEARKLLVAEYRSRVDHVLKSRTREDLAAAYAAAGLTPSKSPSEGIS